METLLSVIAGGVLAGVFALIGARYGHILTERSAKIREQDANRKQGDSLRLLIKLEIDQNLSILVDHWARFQATHMRADDLARMVPPVWRTSVWSSHTGLFALAFDENTISRISALYGNLEQLSAIHNQLMVFQRGDDYADANPVMMNPLGRLGGGTPMIPVHRIDLHGPDLISDWKAIAQETLKDANPLRSEWHTVPASTIEQRDE